MKKICYSQREYSHSQACPSFMDCSHLDLAKEKGVKEKVDIADTEYEHFMKALEKRLES